MSSEIDYSQNSYEENFKRLKEISEDLSKGENLTVDRIETLYDEAQKRHAACAQRISALQRKISGGKSE